MWKRGETSPLFHNIFSISPFSGVKLYIHLWNVVVWFIFFPQFCKSDMSRYGYLEVFQIVPGLRDNESRLYNKNTMMKQSKGLNGALNKNKKGLHLETKNTEDHKPDHKPQTGGRWARPQIRWYSRLSLSRSRLSRITAYLEVKIWSLVLTQRSSNRQQNIVEKRRNCSKYCGKEEKLLLRSNFSSFPQYFQYIFNSGAKLHIHSVKGGCSINCFPQFRKSDMSKYGYLEVFYRVPWISR